MKQTSFQVLAAITAVVLLSGCPAILDIINYKDSTTTTTTTTLSSTTTTTVESPTTTTTSTTTTTLSEPESRTLYSGDSASGYDGKLPIISGGKQYIVQNNIIDSIATQVVEYSTSTGNFTIKEHTGSSSEQPVSFPSIFIGNNNEHATTDSNLPNRNIDIRSLRTTWTWSDSGISAADFLPLVSLWFTESETGNIYGPEKWLEIWLYKPPSHNPSGSPIAGRVTIGESTWDVWEYGSNITYVASSEVSSVNFDLKSFIADAITKGTISNTDYLHDVIAGFRIWSGGAELSSSGFSASVE